MPPLIPLLSRRPALRPDADGVFHAASFDTAAWAVPERATRAARIASAPWGVLVALLIGAVCLGLAQEGLIEVRRVGPIALVTLVFASPLLAPRAAPVRHRRIRIDASGIVVDRLAPLEKLDTTALLSGPGTERQIFDWDLVTGIGRQGDVLHLQTLLTREGFPLSWVPEPLARDLERRIRAILAERRAADLAARPVGADAAALKQLTREARREH